MAEKKHIETSQNDLFFVLDLLDKSKITYWLDGGWGVDVLTGKQHRPHRDIDIDFDAAHTEKLLNLLLQNGWSIETNELPCRVELYNPEHGYIDIHPFELLNDGKARQSDLLGSFWVFEADFFTKVIFENRIVPCISVKGQKIFHSGYELREKDIFDLKNLSLMEEENEQATI